MNSPKSSDPLSSQTVIAVDGHSSCGKSTFARMIARELGLVYIDSGAMYRAVALYCLENGILTGSLPDGQKLADALPVIDIRFRVDASGNQETLLNGVNVEEKIRGIAVSSVVSLISQQSTVREKMVALQRQMGENGHVVMDGRDIGTVVFPFATLKIFMTADPDVRAKRRYDELIAKGTPVSFDEIAANVRMRDHEDENRAASPLRKAADAVVLDNSHMTVAEQMDWFRELWKNRTDHA
jgi:cytidylate kinase